MRFLRPKLDSAAKPTSGARSSCAARKARLRGTGSLAALILLVAAGCRNIATAPVGPEDQRLLLAKASVAKAQELYTLALRADSAGQLYRPMLLRALVDGLQFGAPIQNIPIRIGGSNQSFSAISQDAVLTSAGATASSAGMLLAWRGTNAEQILVILVPYGPGVDPAAFNTIGFYLDTDDTPRIATSGSTDFRFDPPGLSCAYRQATPLLGPPGQCVEERLAAAFNLAIYANGDATGAPQSIQVNRTNVNGVRITRSAADYSASSARFRKQE